MGIVSYCLNRVKTRDPYGGPHANTFTANRWVPAVDDYPMKSISAKDKWLRQAFENNYKFFFYHDQFFAVAEFDKEGKFVNYIAFTSTSDSIY